MSKFFSKYEKGLFSLLGVLIKDWGSVRAQSAVNKYRDYRLTSSDVNRLELHKKLYQIILESRRSWESYDYGEGYFYQGLKALGITGLRDTDARIEATKLKNLVAGKNVLEIGCNTGFLSLGISDSATKITGFDINPYLISVAQECAQFLKIENVDFKVTTFEEFDTQKTYECVISFANHSTYDGNTKHSLNAYFQKCSTLLSENGLLIFESHPPIIEKNNFNKIVELIEENFSIISNEKLQYGSQLDANRTFLIGKKR